MTTTDAYLILSLLPKIGPVRVRRLVERFGSPERVLSASRAELRKVEGLGPETVETVASWEDQVDLEAEKGLIGEFDLELLTLDSEDYPPLLREIHSAPFLLYLRGTLEKRDRHGIAVVGSRRATHYGTEATRKLSFQLSYAGVTIVSGLARGIDTAAHEAALAAKGRTIAVIGSGHGELYPPENAALAERIAQNGAVLSEFPVRQRADKKTFPLRNRIVSGMCLGTLVTEAPEHSGALITASQALEQGRNVYAVPGPIDRPNSAGTNRLIQQGAKLVMDSRDVLEDLEMLFPIPNETPDFFPAKPATDLSEDELSVYNAIEDGETGIDFIIERSGLPSARVSSTLLRLEMKRLVKQLPGKFFVKLV